MVLTFCIFPSGVQKKFFNFFNFTWLKSKYICNYKHENYSHIFDIKKQFLKILFKNRYSLWKLFCTYICKFYSTAMGNKSSVYPLFQFHITWQKYKCNLIEIINYLFFKYHAIFCPLHKLKNNVYELTILSKIGYNKTY